MREFASVDAERTLTRPNIITASETLGQMDTVNVIDGPAANVAVVLPPVDLAAGKHYSFFCKDEGSATTFTVTQDSTAAGSLGTVAAAALAADDYLLLYCDGYKWYVILDGLSDS